MRLKILLLLAVLAACVPRPSYAQTWADPSGPLTISCGSLTTADQNCPAFELATEAKGFCIYAIDNGAGGSTWNLDLQAVFDGNTYSNWTAAGGASKAAVNEGASCWYPTTISPVPTPNGQTADIVLVPVPRRGRIVIDKTAAVATSFSIVLFQLR